MSTRLRVGLIGAGDVAQVIHLPVLSLLSHLYQVTAICDISAKTVEHCAAKFGIKQYSTDPQDVYGSAEVDVVFVLTSDDFHEEYAVASLQAGKHVMMEKPISLSIPSVQRIIDAEDKAGGPRVFVGYMRRYARSFTQAFKRELATIPRILYARSRDFAGSNAYFINSSGTFSVRNTDLPPSAAEERDKRLDRLFAEALRTVTPESKKFCRFLGGLGSHDLSLLREALGMPDSVSGVSANDPFYSAIFNYRNSDGTPFSVTYESSFDDLPEFDAHLAVYGEKKRISINYDTPFVKGLAITVKVTEYNEHGEKQTREILSSYEDAYTTELQELHECLTKGKEIKTSSRDALQDLKIFDMLYQKAP